jgi:hypothetical protein
MTNEEKIANLEKRVEELTISCTLQIEINKLISDCLYKMDIIINSHDNYLSSFKKG